MKYSNRPNKAQKRQLCELYGHQVTPKIGEYLYCRRCGDLLGAMK